MKGLRTLMIIWGIVLCMLLSSCASMRPTLLPSVTVPPTASPTPAPMVEPTVDPTPEVTPSATSNAENIDALGNPITSADHFTNYITFGNIQVYEENGDTFVDCVAFNEYPEPIICAVDIVFYEGEEEVARAQLQTRDGLYLLVLNSGQTVLFAHVLTDMTITDFEFTIEFNLEAGVHP